MEKPFLLITNDDGIAAPGLKHLWYAVRDYANTAIIAPHVEKSGCGLSITWTKPLRIQPYTWEDDTPTWSINGTPADCVKMACNVILDRPPHMIISGVNRGSNAGRTVLYSGTFGGIIEGAYKDIPGIAFSFCDTDTPPVSATQEYIVALIRHFLAHPCPRGTILNVTFPPNCKKGVTGLRLATQGLGYWREAPEKRIHPEGIPYYWLGGKWHSFEEDPQSDVALLERGYITVVPIRITQLTDYETFSSRRQAIDAMFPSSFVEQH